MKPGPLKKVVQAAVDKWAQKVNAELYIEAGAIAKLVELVVADLKAASPKTDQPRRSKSHKPP